MLGQAPCNGSALRARPPAGCNSFAFVAKVEVELAVRAEDEGVHGMIVIDAFDVGEENFALVRLAVAVGVREHEDVGRRGNDHLIAEHADAERRVDRSMSW